MSIESRSFQLTDEELTVLTAFCLALPVPPLMFRSGTVAASPEVFQEQLQQASLSLQAKGLLGVAEPGSQQGLVLPELAQMLRAMAYGNQMVHLYLQHHGRHPSQVAWYHFEGSVIRQELMADGQHSISHAESDLGRAEIEAYVDNASEHKGTGRVQIPLETWHTLLSVRAAGAEQDDPTATDNESSPALNFLRQMLAANTILEVTWMYDRLGGKGEVARVVITEDTTWLLGPAYSAEEQPKLLIALPLGKHDTVRALSSLFTSMTLIVESEIKTS